MLIMLLNFLIAIISQSYDQVMTSQMVLLYQQRCEFNIECSMVLDFFEELSGREELTKVYVISADLTSEID